jgi:hypothetical protein
MNGFATQPLKEGEIKGVPSPLAGEGWGEGYVNLFLTFIIVCPERNFRTFQKKG